MCNRQDSKQVSEFISFNVSNIIHESYKTVNRIKPNLKCKVVNNSLKAPTIRKTAPTPT